MKQIGKIQSIHLGTQEGYFGLFVTLSGKGWGVTSSQCFPDPATRKHTKECKWTEEDRAKDAVKLCAGISAILKDAQQTSLDALKNVPIEATFEDHTLISWRILTEVL